MAGLPLFRPSNISSGLQGYWKFDNDAIDSSGNDRNLTANGTPTYNTTDYWKGATAEKSSHLIAASSQYYALADDNALDFNGSSFTVACFVKFTSLANSNTMAAKCNWAPTNGYIFYNEAGGTRLAAELNNSSFVGVNGSLSAGKWHHCAMVRDISAGTLTFYVDGNVNAVLACSVTLAGNASPFEVGRTAAPVYAGMDQFDLGIWNVALTPIQIKSLALGVDLSLYTYRPNNVSTAPTHYYKLNELSDGSGPITRVDSALSGGINLTDNNTVATGAGYIEGAGAKLVSANSEYLSAADSADWDFGTGDFTITVKTTITTTDAFSMIWDRDVNSRLYYTHGGTTILAFGLNYSVTLANNTVYMITVKRVSGVLHCYVDGVSIGTPQAFTTDVQGTSGFFVGTNFPLSTFSNQLMSDLAIWKGYAVADAEIKSLACGIPLQQTGLVSYWKLDETSGTRADSIGANSLTDNNTVLYGTGKVSNAADFEASASEYLSITDGSQVGLDLDTDLALIGWLKTESSGADLYLMDKDGGANGYSMIVTSGNVARMEIQGTGLNGTTSIASGTWYHFSGTWDGYARRVYINSAQENSSTVAVTPAGNAEAFRLGAFKTPSNYFDGLMDEWIIAKRWFRDEEIKTIYCKGLAGKELTYSEIQLGGNQIIWML